MYNSSKSLVKDLSLCQLSTMISAKFLTSSPNDVLICLVPSTQYMEGFSIKSGVRGIFSLDCDEHGSSTSGILRGLYQLFSKRKAFQLFEFLA